jgi:hypothetical protein
MELKPDFNLNLRLYIPVTGFGGRYADIFVDMKKIKLNSVETIYNTGTKYL